VIAKLDESVAVITGGASGIGRATALSLAASGARVVVADINDERGHQTAEDVRTVGSEAVYIRTDVSSDEDVAGLRTAALDVFGRVDIVMNNVGVLEMGTPENVPIEAWRRVIDLNLLSVVRSIQTFLPGLLAQGSGHIINTASTAGLWAYAYDRVPYSATKGAVVALTEALALYARHQGVGVSLLCPGPIRTNIAEHVQVHGPLAPIQPPALPLLDAAVVGDQVLQAIRDDAYLILTHAEVRDVLLAKAADPEQFVRQQSQHVWGAA
jgi:NAD(P)-dependent dehydrogenase (short-subunit alcohol dehydrogenase family)